ncbi:hypothetical protein CBS147482_2924 [Aspergillus niger]|nr:hypothetical protein CBS147482_2924 [Aspergillus niger]
MFNRSIASPKGGVWTKVVIFISLYVMLFDSFIEWAIVLYLYGIRRVDSKMTPSLVLALVASFFTVPLVALHSLLAWQYNKVVGFASQKALLNAACTYILRLTILIWIAASAAGLVLVSQQMYCLADDGGGDFWKIGISCALQRASVIVSIISFVTVCLFFCSRELCERPYDISLLGVYKPQLSSYDDKMSASSTMGSHVSLENDIYHVCRRPDVTFGRDLYLSSSSNSICKAGSIEHPVSVYEKPQLKLDTKCEAETSGIYSGTTLSVDGTPSKNSSRDGTNSDVSSNASTTPPKATLRAPFDSYRPAVLAELPGSPQIKNQRHQASGSPFFRLLPKVFASQISLSSDPDILALAGPDSGTDVEQPAEEKSTEIIEPPPTPKREYAPGHPLASSPVELPFPTSPPVERSMFAMTNSNPELKSSRSEGSTLPRSISSSSADAPEVLQLLASTTSLGQNLRLYLRSRHDSQITATKALYCSTDDPDAKTRFVRADDEAKSTVLKHARYRGTHKANIIPSKAATLVDRTLIPTVECPHGGVEMTSKSCTLAPGALAATPVEDSAQHPV